ncbi:MAG: hypothetical protein AAFZ58_15755, partial [Pseudomonadota bacterium]
ALPAAVYAFSIASTTHGNTPMKRITAVATLLTLSFFGTQAVAEDDRAAKIQEQMQQTIERLDLTDEQIEKIKPIMQESMEARQKIMASYGIDPENSDGAGKLGMRKARAMRKEMNAINAGTLSELEQILTAEQLNEYKAIQKERQAEMKERIRGSR